MQIIKRSGAEAPFDKQKIVSAISKANASIEETERIPEGRAMWIADRIEAEAAGATRALSVEEVQDKVEEALMSDGYFSLARSYITYRYEHALKRKGSALDDRVLALINGDNEELKQENSNKNPTIISVQRDYMAGEISKELCRNYLYPADVIAAHDDGVIHIHDMDYVIGKLHNCELINLEDMLQNGTVINGSMVERPRSFLTACTVATQISASVASNTFGGQTISLAHLAPFIDVSRQKIRAQVEEELSGHGFTEEELSAIVERRVCREVASGVQTIQYQVSTIMCSNGQTPFISLMMYLNEAKNEREKADLAMLIEEVLKQRIQGVKNEVGVYVSPAFPKLLYTLTEENCREGTKYWHLTELAARCTAKRLVPDYISEKKMLEYKIDRLGIGRCYPCMGCRAFLTPYVDENNQPKYYGRFNMGACTLNLPYVALLAGGKGHEDEFWRVLDEKADICYRAQQIRASRLKGASSDLAPILWQHGALARLAKGEKIDKLLYGGYATISLGYAGLWECVYALTGKKLTEPDGEEFGLRIMKRLNEYTAKWKKEQNMDSSLYGTPLESTTYKFAKALQRKFGIIPGVSDRNYISNSYHVHVTEHIDAFEKLALEAKFQRLSPGGAISYVEVPDLQQNIPAVIALIKFIYDNIMYAELNTKSDYCHVCGFDGEIKVVEADDGKLVWECPNCGNRDQRKMNVVRRTCGYLGSQFWNQGRTQEIKERVLHVD